MLLPLLLPLLLQLPLQHLSLPPLPFPPSLLLALIQLLQW
jgi:hypothetical protein